MLVEVKGGYLCGDAIKEAGEKAYSKVADAMIVLSAAVFQKITL
jgi:hypothetical protein